MSVIKIVKKTKHNTEQVELIIGVLCLINGLKLSNTAKRILAYYVVYGLKDKTDTLLIESKVIKDLPALRNIKTKLRKMGFLKRSKELYRSYELALEDGFTLDPVMTLFIKIDRS